MSTSIAPPPVAPASADHGMPSLVQVFTRAMRPIRAAAKTAIFFFKIFPMLPSRPLDWVTSPPVIERVSYPKLGKFFLAVYPVFRQAVAV